MIRSYQGIKVSKGDSQPVNDALVVESPFAIYINGEPLTVTMQTPGHEHFLGRDRFKKRNANPISLGTNGNGA
jgi:formate dehydrogenase assembly factor FdhD